MKIKKISKKNYFLSIFLAIIVLFFISFCVIDAAIRPNVLSYSKKKAENYASGIVHDAVSEVLNETGMTYTDIVDVTKSSDGYITAIQTNSVTVNQLKSQIIQRVRDKLEAFNQQNIKIPIGNLVGVNFLMGAGPKVPFKLAPAGQVTAELRDSFASAGINQTKHQIHLDISVEISVLVPGYAQEVQMNTQFMIADTVIVGDVPGSYSSINGDSRDIISKANDYAVGD